MKNRNTIFTTILLVLACFGLLPKAQAVSPAPDGFYAGGNTAEGQNALLSLSSGGYNTAVGFFSLRSNTAGNFNTAIGAGTLLANTADFNTATGAGALLSNNAGNTNTANGAFALFSNITGSFNTAIGESALSQNTVGSSNIALGFGAGSGVSTASDVICISATGENVSNSCYIDHIFAQQVGPMGAAVVVDTHGKLGTVVSSRRFKHDIKPMDKASEALLALKPVTFHYKGDTKDTPQFGLIAEEVAEVNSDLILREKNGEILSVRYDQVNAMLLNEFLKEHRKVQQLEATVGQQQKSFQSRLAEQEKKIEALTSGLQKVSAQLEMTKPAPQMALSNL